MIDYGENVTLKKSASVCIYSAPKSTNLTIYFTYLSAIPVSLNCAIKNIRNNTLALSNISITVSINVDNK